ncbi:MAG: isopentenyl-diphosphate Delta-isomerase [Verrucomicrobia bacterium]|nr:MAG: isopentenyl-diphosphate Delta-isomerase [Verrucomicrobiota bacterium]
MPAESLSVRERSPAPTGRGEAVVLLADDGRPIGTARKSEVHGPATPLHLAFSIFLFDAGGRMLVQRRAWHKPTWPGVWSNACCGHPQPGEAMEAAVARRLREELGMTGVTVHPALPDFRYRACWQGVWENEVCPVFIGMASGAVRPNPEEVAEVDWVEWTTFAAACREPAGTAFADFSPWSLLEGRRLDETGVVRRLLEEGQDSLD